MMRGKQMNLLMGLLAAVLAPLALFAGDEPEVHIDDITQTVVKMSLRSGVSISDATQAMTAKAVELNLKVVGRQVVHEELRARGQQARHLEILQFCDPEDAVKMVTLDPIYAAYMPCRIAVVEDAGGRAWLLMLNLDMLVNSNTLPPELQEIAIRVNQTMLAVMTAGVTGEF